MPILPPPVALWDERPGADVAHALTRLVPAKTAAGYWVFTPAIQVPAGATRGALVQGAEYSTLTTTTTDGLRATKLASGTVLLY